MSYSFSEGAPFRHVLRRLHLVTKTGLVRAWWLALLAWLPIALGEGMRVLLNETPDPTFFDISVHVRPLVALPMMFVGEWLVEPAARSAITSLYVGNFYSRTTLEAIVGRAEHIRDSWLPEAILFATAMTFGQLALWHVTGATGTFHGGAMPLAWSFPRMWYVGFALPLTQFVMLRWMWRWTVWSYLLARIARLPLVTLATHPDRAAGLACTARPMSGFGMFTFAGGSILAGAWGTELLAGRTTIEALVPAIVVFLVAALVIAVAPAIPFTGHLYRTRRRGMVQYGDFAGGYSHAFHAKWVGPEKEAAEALGTPDIQSFADLDGVFAIVKSMRLFAFGMRSVGGVWLGAALPMLPLLASRVTVEHVLQKIFSTILGGLPV